MNNTTHVHYANYHNLTVEILEGYHCPTVNAYRGEPIDHRRSLPSDRLRASCGVPLPEDVDRILLHALVQQPPLLDAIDRAIAAQETAPDSDEAWDTYQLVKDALMDILAPSSLLLGPPPTPSTTPRIPQVFFGRN